MPTLALIPDEDGYSFVDPVGVMHVPSRGGLPRTRADVINANIVIGVQWTCDPDEFEYLVDFEKANRAANCEPFDIQLLLDGADAKTYSAILMPDSFQLIFTDGESFIVGAQLEVSPDVWAANEIADATTSNAGIGDGGAGYFPPVIAVPPSTDYTLWDIWHFEDAEGDLTLTSENARIIELYDDPDAQTISSAQFFAGARSLRKGGGTPIEMFPARPTAAKWNISFRFNIPTAITGSSGYFMYFNSPVGLHLTFQYVGGVQKLQIESDSEAILIDITNGVWHELKIKTTDTAEQVILNGVTVWDEARVVRGYPATYTPAFTIGRGGYDYYYGSYWFMDEFRIGVEGVV